MQKYKSQTGSTTIGAPIVTAVSVFLIALLIVVAVNILIPFIWYEKLSIESLKYIFVMEEFGYLTEEEKSSLLDELAAQNFDPDGIDIAATDKPVEYGDPIFLNITYKYTFNLPFIAENPFSAEKGEKTVDMFIRRQSVSKR